MKHAVLGAALAAVLCLVMGGCPATPLEIGDLFAQSAADSSAGSQGFIENGAVLDEAVLGVGACDCFIPLEADSWTDEVLVLVNLEREKAGVGPLTWNRTLADQAEQYACELICDDFFAHVNPVTGSTLTDRSLEFDYAYWAIGENLAAGQSTPEAAVEAWMNSPGHRTNILHPAFTELGIAVRTGGDYGIYWVQEFGRPRSEGPYEPAN